MTLIQLNAFKDALRSKLHELERITPACKTCEKFSQGRCQQYNAEPPADFVAGPCECLEWSHDGIPF